MRTKLRVAALIWQGKRWMGGWNYYLNAARILRRHSERVELALFVPQDIDEESLGEAENASGLPVNKLPKRRKIDDMLHLLGGYSVAVARLMSAADVDLVLEQACFLGRRFPKPVISWIADLQHREYPQYFTPYQRISRDVGFWAQVNARKNVYVSSESARQDLLDYVQIPGANVHVLRFAVCSPLNVTADGVMEVKRRFGLKDYIFLPNQLWPHKNHAIALQAMELTSKKDRVLVLTGDPAQAANAALGAELSRLSGQPSVSDRVRWLGRVSQHDLVHLIGGAAALINPSKFEGWSTTVEEAKSVGAPMLLADIPVHREQGTGPGVSFFSPDNVRQLAAAMDELPAATDVSLRLSRAAALNTEAQRIYAHEMERIFEAAALKQVA